MHVIIPLIFWAIGQAESKQNAPCHMEKIEESLRLMSQEIRGLKQENRDQTHEIQGLKQEVASVKIENEQLKETLEEISMCQYINVLCKVWLLKVTSYEHRSFSPPKVD